MSTVGWFFLTMIVGIISLTVASIFEIIYNSKDKQDKQDE